MVSTRFILKTKRSHLGGCSVSFLEPEVTKLEQQGGVLATANAWLANCLHERFQVQCKDAHI